MIPPTFILLLVLVASLPHVTSVPVTPPPLTSTCAILGAALCHGGSTCTMGEDGFIICLCPEGRSGNSCQFVSDGANVTSAAAGPVETTSPLTSTSIPGTHTTPARRGCGIVKTLFCPKAESCYFDLRDTATCICAPGYTGVKCDVVMEDSPGSADTSENVTPVPTTSTEEPTSTTAAEVLPTRKPCGFLKQIACPEAEGCYLDESSFARCICGPGRTGQKCDQVISSENASVAGATTASAAATTRRTCGAMSVFCFHASACFLEPGGVIICVCEAGYTGSRCGTEIAEGPGVADQPPANTTSLAVPTTTPSSTSSAGVTRRSCGFLKGIACPEAVDCYLNGRGFATCVCGPGRTGRTCVGVITTGNASATTANITTAPTLPPTAPSFNVSALCSLCLHVTSCDVPDGTEVAVCTCSEGWKGAKCDEKTGEDDGKDGDNLPGVGASSTKTGTKPERPDGLCGIKQVCTSHTQCDDSGSFRCDQGWGGDECCLTCDFTCSPGHCAVSYDGREASCVCPEGYMYVPGAGCLDVCDVEPAKHDVCAYDHESKDTQRYVIVGAVLGTLFLLAACLITFVCVVRHCAYRN